MNTTDIRKWNNFEEFLADCEHAAPDDPALLYAAGDTSVQLSRAAFAAAAKKRAAELAAGNSTCLGVLCDGSADCVLTIFGSVLAGLQTVLLDENAPDELLAEQIRKTDIDSLWGDEELCEDLTPYLTDGLTDGRTDILTGSRTHRILFFTSGTTSRSKAVVLTDSNLMAAAYNGSRMLPLSKDDTLLCMLPLNHVFGFVCGLLWGLECGTPVALGRGMRYYTQDPVFFRPTVVSAVPALLAFLLQHHLINEELRLVLVGAGDCPERILSAAKAAGLQISFGYGLTETSSGVAISVSGDPYALSVCPEDTVTLAKDGEILVRSESCMMQGYYRQPEDTAAVLKEGVLYTGDLGRLDENGLLHIVGRKKEILVLSDGTKIFLPEYEERIAAAMPGADFAVTVLQGRPVLVVAKSSVSELLQKAAIRQNNPGGRDASDGKDPSGSDPDTAHLLQQFLGDIMSRLPHGQQISRIILTGQPLPRTAAGKLIRWEIQNLAGQACHSSAATAKQTAKGPSASM